MSFGVKLTGDWRRAGRILGSGIAKLDRAMNIALKQEGQFFRAELVKGIRSQAPGGKAFKPLSPVTLARRRARGFGGTKALIETASMIRSIVVIQVGSVVFVGILYSARNREGKSLVNIAAVHEFGAIVTRSIHSVQREGASLSVAIVIPARPFFRPVFKQFYNNLEAQRRFVQRVARAFSGSPGAALFQW